MIPVIGFHLFGPQSQMVKSLKSQENKFEFICFSHSLRPFSYLPFTSISSHFTTNPFIYCTTRRSKYFHESSSKCAIELRNVNIDQFHVLFIENAIWWNKIVHKSIIAFACLLSHRRSSATIVIVCLCLGPPPEQNDWKGKSTGKGILYTCICIFIHSFWRMEISQT